MTQKILTLLAALSLATPITRAADAPATTQPTRSPVRKLARFVPKAEDAPERVSAGVARGGPGKGDPAFEFQVLVPPTSYLTTRTSPSLFWFTTRPTTRKLLITLVDPSHGDTKVYSTEYSDPLAAGIQRLDLSKVGVKLEPGHEYKWIFEFYSEQGTVDLERKSIGYLKVLPKDDPRATQLAAATDPQQRLDLCAQQGLWYDLLSELQDQVDRYPADADLRKARADLVAQVRAMIDDAQPKQSQQKQ